MVNCDALALLQSLPGGSVGAIISDPPFHVSVGRTAPSGSRPVQQGFTHDPWTEVSSLDEVIEWTRPHVAEAARVLRPGGALVVMGGTQSLVGWDIACARLGFQWMAEIIVLWNSGKPRARNFGSLHTRVVWYSRTGLRHAFNSDARSIYSNIIVCRKVHVSKRSHPSEKPVGLTNFLVSLLTNYGDLVVDPFAGSGSTLVSAALAGRDYLGADVDPRYAEAARVRVLHADNEDIDPVFLWVNGRLEEIAA